MGQHGPHLGWNVDPQALGDGIHVNDAADAWWGQAPA
jgi:hypothetical protein